MSNSTEPVYAHVERNRWPTLTEKKDEKPAEPEATEASEKTQPTD